MAQKMLIQEGTGRKYVWSEGLAARKDMRPYNPDRDGELDAPAAKKTVAIELQGKTFQVSTELHEVLSDMAAHWLEMQDQNKALAAEKEDFEATKERLTTDILDLQEQLAAAKAPPVLDLDLAAPADTTTKASKKAKAE